MNNGSNKSINDIVSRSIRFEKHLDESEECIVSTCNQELVDACKVICEWVVRTPHAYPFNDSGIFKKDTRGFLRYQQSLMECVSCVGVMVIQESDFGDAIHLKISPVIKKIVDSIKSWLLDKEKSDKEMFDFLTQTHYNYYRVMSRHERRRYEAAMNELSWHMRKQLMDTHFRKKVHGFKKNSTKCFKQVMGVCSQAWERCSSVLLIRLDWGYMKKVPDVRGVFESAEDYEHRFKQVSEYRAQMLKALQKMYKKDLVFFVWKIECGSVRGLHIHWLIGINGAKHQDRVNVPRAIADKWDKVLGLGTEDAYTRNINAHQKHETAILRVIDYSDPILWRIVGGYADYLTKVDYLVRHRTPGGMRSFGSTKLAENVKKKKGPQRGKKMPELDLWAVRRPLNEQFTAIGAKGSQ